MQPLQEFSGFRKPDRLTIWVIGLNTLTGLAGISVLIGNASFHSLSMGLLALLPPVGILSIYRFPRFLTLFKGRGDPRSDLTFVIVAPGIGMFFAYLVGSDPAYLVDFFALSYWILVTLLCYVASLFRIAWGNTSRWGALFGLPIVGGMYGIGTINTVNSLLDQSAPRHYRTKIVQMYEPHGKYGMSYFQLAPWGPLIYDDDVDVPKRTYKEKKIGDAVCIDLRPGVLHGPWYVLVPCPKELPPPASTVP